MNKLAASSKKQKTNPNKLLQSAPTQAVWVVVLTLLIFFGAQISAAILLSLLASVFFGSSSTTISDAFETNNVVRFLLILTIEAFTVWFVYASLKSKKLSLKSIGLQNKPSKKDFVAAIKAVAIYFVAFFVIFNIVDALQIIDTNQPQQLGFNDPQGIGLLLTFISLVVLPPLAEEILFRGFLFHRLNEYAPKIAAVITSILFAAAHLELGSGVSPNWAAALDTFVLSIVLVHVTSKSKSLWPAIIVHAVKNCIAFLVLFVF